MVCSKFCFDAGFANFLTTTSPMGRLRVEGSWSRVSGGLRPSNSMQFLLTPEHFHSTLLRLSSIGGLGFRVQGLRCRVWGLSFKV